MTSIDFLEVSQANDLRTFKRKLIEVSGNLGFPLVGCVLTTLGPAVDRPRAVFRVGNPPEAYQNSYSDLALTMRDPVMTFLREHKFQTITYDQSLYVASGTADLWDEQASFGYQTGMAVSLDLPGNQRFSFGVNRDRPLPEGAELTALRAGLLHFAVHAQAAASRLQRDAGASAAGNPVAGHSLTGRELECLKWTRESKTAWEVGQILGISTSTVALHLSNARKKLGCYSKHQAVLKAIQDGLIS